MQNFAENEFMTIPELKGARYLFNEIPPRMQRYAYPFVNDQRWYAQFPTLLENFVSIDPELRPQNFIMHVGSVAPVLSMLPELVRMGITNIWLVDSDQLISEFNQNLFHILKKFANEDPAFLKLLIAKSADILLSKYDTNTQGNRPSSELLYNEGESFGDYNYLNRVPDVVDALSQARFIFSCSRVGSRDFLNVANNLRAGGYDSAWVSTTNVGGWMSKLSGEIRRQYTAGLRAIPNSESALYTFAAHTDEVGHYPVVQPHVIGVKEYYKAMDALHSRIPAVKPADSLL